MTDRISPALTPEEWAKVYYERGLEWGMNCGNGERGWVTVGRGDSDPKDRTRISDASRHAAAALCLYGQPFGFTREDVEALRQAYVVLESEACGRPDVWIVVLASLADRIAAILPPETP